MGPRLLSFPLGESTPGYGGKKDHFKLTQKSCMDCGDTANSQLWEIYNHHGTHVDCPLHFCPGGKMVCDYKADDWFFQKVYLINYKAKPGEIIDLMEHRQFIPNDADCCLVKTSFQEYRSQEMYWKNNPGLSPELGSWLKQNRPTIKIIGFDFISLTSFQQRELGRESHRKFLSFSHDHQGIRIIEDMNLASLTSAPKQLLVSPLFVENADSAPVTVWGF
jgi:kynurenine formamidase